MNTNLLSLLDRVPARFERMWQARLKWRQLMHPYQVQPRGDWDGWMLRSGRGAGKTQTGAFDAAEHSLDNPSYRYGVIAPTLGDVRSTALEGETGILAALTEGNARVPGMGFREDVDFTYNRSLLEIDFDNGSQIKGFGTEKPNRLRGPAHHRLWFEELASFKDAHLGDALNTTFNNAMLGLRLGARARWIATTTPRRMKLIIELDERPEVVTSRGSTYDNIDNLSDNFKRTVLRYEGTHIGQQELLGEILLEVEGAHWTGNLIDSTRIDRLPEFARIHVGVDPSGGSDVIGIVAVGESFSCHCGSDGELPHYVAIDDASLLGTPEQWASAVAETYWSLEADLITAERNYGGDMVEAVIRNVDRNLPVKHVNASRGKHVRAQPIAHLMQTGRMHHYRGFPDMETEMTTYTPDITQWSPNRMDAMVWAATSLIDKLPTKYGAY